MYRCRKGSIVSRFPCQWALWGSTLLFFVIMLTGNRTMAQENNPYIAYNVPAQNSLKFNRFLINPTFSAVREDKSYLNMFHRNQSAFFEDNLQSYFLSYSGKINDNIGLGVSIYHQQEGVMSNIGIMANYAYGVRLTESSSLTLGINIPYFRSGFDHGRANIGDDPLISDLKHSSILMVQPGVNISIGNWDVGVFAENLYDINLATGESLTPFGEKTFSGHLQYVHNFPHYDGIFEDGRLLPLARVRLIDGEDLTYGGGVILDLPKLGWVQGGYDSFYGGSAGIGFNLSRRLSLGYNFEKGFSGSFGSLGITHEISIALSFAPKEMDYSPRGRHPAAPVPTRKKKDNKDNTGQSRDLTAELERLRKEFLEKEEKTKNLQSRIESLETDHLRDLERSTRMVMEMVRQETRGTRPDLEEKAGQMMLDQERLGKSSGPRDLEMRAKRVMEMVQREANKTKPKTDTETKKYGINNATGQDASTEIIKRSFSDVPGISTGYYIVANVFGTEKYLKSFVEELIRRGLDAKYFKNPENGLNYVFLAHYEEHKMAEDEIRSKLQGKYFNEMWIMHVDNSRLKGMEDKKSGTGN